MLAVHLDIGDIVLEDGRDVDLCAEVLVSCGDCRHSVMCVLGDSVAGLSAAITRRNGKGMGSGQRRTSGKVPLEKTL